MADVKREVWVRELPASGRPLKVALTRRGADGGLQCRVVRYVPASDPQPKAQGDGWVKCSERMPEVSGAIGTLVIAYTAGAEQPELMLRQPGAPYPDG